MRVALGQFNAVLGDLAGNAERIRRVYGEAVKGGADLVVFPELAICGYPPEDLLLKKHFLLDNRWIVEKLAGDLGTKQFRQAPKAQATVIVGFAESNQAATYNSAAVLERGHVTRIYRKGLLPNYGVFDERRYFQPGTEPVVLQLGGLRIAVSVCEDIWDIEWLSRFLGGVGGIQVLVNISASPFHVGRTEERQSIVARCAKRFGCAVCYCNLVGGQDELIFDGRSMVVDGNGDLSCRAQAFEEDLLLADVVVAGDGMVQVNSVGPSAAQPEGPIDEVYRALVLGTRDYVRKNGFSKVLIGLSGGIDSCVTAAIAAEALGAENVVGITMPSQFNSPETQSDAEKLAANLGAAFLTIPISPILEQFDRSLRSAEGWDSEGIGYENLQARIRGSILMSLSNSMGSMVLTTGNKSEIAVGYTTLYGDTAGGFAVIKDVPKTMVYELAEHINHRAGRQIIPAAVISRAPSAELKAGQKDTDSLPAYDLLDRIIKGYVEQDKSAQELSESGLAEDVVRRVIQMVDRNEYKRRQSPPGVKITPKAFGKDRRLPITNRYGETVERK